MRIVHQTGRVCSALSSTYTLPTAPAAVTALAAIDLFDTSARFTWTDSGSAAAPAESLKVKCVPTGQPSTFTGDGIVLLAAAVSRGAQTATLTDLKPDTVYDCFIISSNAGADVASTSVTVHTLAAPSAPRNVFCTGAGGNSATGIKCTWTDVAFVGYSGCEFLCVCVCAHTCVCVWLRVLGVFCDDARPHDGCSPQTPSPIFSPPSCSASGNTVKYEVRCEAASSSATCSTSFGASTAVTGILGGVKTGTVTGLNTDTPYSWCVGGRREKVGALKVPSFGILGGQCRPLKKLQHMPCARVCARAHTPPRRR